MYKDVFKKQNRLTYRVSYTVTRGPCSFLLSWPIIYFVNSTSVLAPSLSSVVHVTTLYANLIAKFIWSVKKIVETNRVGVLLLYVIHNVIIYKQSKYGLIFSILNGKAKVVAWLLQSSSL